MARGGFREGAGKKSEWKHSANASETKLIRVPIMLADEILALARKLDKGEITQDDDSKEKIDKVYTVISEYQAASKNTRNWVECNKMLQELQNIITEK
jgi:hypothetical protein